MKPLITKHRGDWKYVEGYFNNSKNHHPMYPIPVSGMARIDNVTLSRLQRLQSKARELHFKGWSNCRICDKKNGSGEFEYNNWVWPNGLLHYIIDHNYMPSEHFLKFVRSRGTYQPRIRWGFTGAQSGCDPKIIKSMLKNLRLKSGDQVVTGACVGVDAQVAGIVRKNYPKVKQVLVVPYNRSKVDRRVYQCADVIYEMPKDTDYRNRNEALVRLSHYMTAFWTGQKRSGTYMTMNIAKRANKLMFVKRISPNK